MSPLRYIPFCLGPLGNPWKPAYPLSVFDLAQGIRHRWARVRFIFLSGIRPIGFTHKALLFFTEKKKTIFRWYPDLPIGKGSFKVLLVH